MIDLTKEVENCLKYNRYENFDFFNLEVGYLAVKNDISKDLTDNMTYFKNALTKKQLGSEIQNLEKGYRIVSNEIVMSNLVPHAFKIKCTPFQECIIVSITIFYSISR